MKCPPAAVSAIVPVALSTYPVTTTPATAQTCRYQSRWHWETDASSSCSGFHRAGSPRNAGSELPGMAGRPSAATSCERSYAR